MEEVRLKLAYRLQIGQYATIYVVNILYICLYSIFFYFLHFLLLMNAREKELVNHNNCPTTAFKTNFWIISIYKFARDIIPLEQHTSLFHGCCTMHCLPLYLNAFFLEEVNFVNPLEASWSINMASHQKF